MKLKIVNIMLGKKTLSDRPDVMHLVSKPYVMHSVSRPYAQHDTVSFYSFFPPTIFSIIHELYIVTKSMCHATRVLKCIRLGLIEMFSRLLCSLVES
jgi:hypothetical protein